MPEYGYEVLVDGVRYATTIDVNIAQLLVKAMFEEWWKEETIAITIKRFGERREDGQAD